MLAVLRLLSYLFLNHSRILNGVRKRRVITPIFGVLTKFIREEGTLAATAANYPTARVEDESSSKLVKARTDKNGYQRAGRCVYSAISRAAFIVPFSEARSVCYSSFFLLFAFFAHWVAYGSNQEYCSL